MDLSKPPGLAIIYEEPLVPSKDKKFNEIFSKKRNEFLDKSQAGTKAYN